jgi:hypothetical protein
MRTAPAIGRLRRGNSDVAFGNTTDRVRREAVATTDAEFNEERFDTRACLR